MVGLSYDAQGNLTSITPPGRAAHIFNATAAGKIAYYEPPDVGIGNTKTEYTYNDDRQLVQIIRPDGKIIDFEYDAAGRKSSLKISRGIYTYGYDGTTGNPNTIVSPDGTNLSFTHDGGLLTSTAWTGPVAGSVSRTFDSGFHVVSCSVNNQNTVNFAYDDDGLMTQAGSLTITRDAQSDLVTETVLGVVTDVMTYNDFGELSHYTAAQKQYDFL